MLKGFYRDRVGKRAAVENIPRVENSLALSFRYFILVQFEQRDLHSASETI